MTIYQILMTKCQRLLKFTTLKGLRIITYFQMHSFMQNKPKVKYPKINVSSFATSKYVLVGHLVIQTNKAKTNPIKANSKPIKPKTNPIQTQSKPISHDLKFDHLICLKLQPTVLLSLRVPNKYSKTKNIMEEKP